MYKIYRVYSKVEGKGWKEEGDNTNRQKALEYARLLFIDYGNAEVKVIKFTGEAGQWQWHEPVMNRKPGKEAR